LALLPVLAPTIAFAASDLYVEGGHGGDGDDDEPLSGGSGWINTYYSVGSTSEDTHGPKKGAATSDNIKLEFSVLPAPSEVESGDLASLPVTNINGGKGGFAKAQLTSNEVYVDVTIIGGDGGTDDSGGDGEGGVGGAASLTTSGDLTVDMLVVKAGTSNDVRGGSASLKITAPGRLIVSGDEGMVWVDKTLPVDVVSFDVAEMRIAGKTVLHVDPFASRDVRIPTLTLAGGSTFEPSLSTDLRPVYNISTLNVAGKNATLASADLTLRSGDVLAFDVTSVASGEKMLTVAGTSRVNIASIDAATGLKLTVTAAPASSVARDASFKLIESVGVINSKDFPKEISTNAPTGSTTAYKYAISYSADGKDMIATYKGTTRTGGGGSSGCSAIGFAPFAILLILGAATLGKRK